MKWTPIIIALLLLGVLFQQLIKIQLMVFFLIMRGILAPSQVWWNISELLIDDLVGINTYRKLKTNNPGKKIIPINILGNTIHILYDVNFMKQLYDQSPNVFGVGKLKMNFFSSFMSKNVGVSHDDVWRHRRMVNEGALDTDKIHRLVPQFHYYLKQLVQTNKPPQDHNDFMPIAQKITMKIVFGDDQVKPEVFATFSEANSFLSLMSGGVSLNSTNFKEYKQYLLSNIQNPKPNSLTELAKQLESDPEELLHQIPHLIFPIVGTFFQTLPRLLLTLCKETRVQEKLWIELSRMHNPNDAREVYQLPYLRKCILEMLRMNTAVVTVFRTLRQNYSFGPGYNYPKGTQLVIFSYPVLRDPQYWNKPEEFIPERWNKDLEQNYWAVMFGQGPQRCPGKELIIFLLQSYIVNWFYEYGFSQGLRKLGPCQPALDTKHFPQVINPFKIKLNYSLNN